MTEYSPLDDYDQEHLGWYKLLREMQDGACLPHILSGKLRHLVDGSGFEDDTLFCEWAYFIDFENKTLTVETGDKFSQDSEKAVVAFNHLHPGWMGAYQRRRRTWEGDDNDEEEEVEDEGHHFAPAIGYIEPSADKFARAEEDEAEAVAEAEHHRHNTSAVSTESSTSVITETIESAAGTPTPTAGSSRDEQPVLTPMTIPESRKRRLSALELGGTTIERTSRVNPYLDFLNNTRVVHVTPGAMISQRMRGQVINADVSSMSI
ncbi:hypothetical protein EHS25_010295 [Saitozyma podzolica]|uniref:Uncharacterized protein n=1 Tax=Saitozyma podzolica TaxID=1890683 RepID=A0A427YJ68_9TREE|nr:hypothetical protein EHS25_010295 [Saitozyma podzolica]